MSIALGQSKALPDQPLPPPPPPSKSQDSSSSRNSPNLPSASFPPLLPPIDASASFDSLSPRSATDPNLATAPSPSAASFPTDQRPKKQNPLVDLIETEKQYVEQLTGIIRKVAAAWSRSNLPPPELDLMFRSIEAIYKANRSLFSRLKDIGTNPSSPKALGDLLMRWIDDLDAPYAAYCERYCTGFDDWPPVLATERLPSTLATFSGVTPPPSGGVWTLDELFLLPKGRLKYYRKLYGRLLKGTQPGRSDHKLLVAAADKLERLLATVDTRARVRVGTEEAASPLPAAPPVMEDEVVVDMRARERDGDVSKPQSPPNGPTGSETSESNRTSNFSSANRHSEDSSALPVIQATIPELETKLAIDRCVDIFTMQPKQVKLQLLPPNLAFRREVRLAFETSMSLTPSKSPETIRYPRGRVFILSDLVLIAEADANGNMFLLFPPLSGKFLKVTRAAGGANNVMEVSVMKKETLVLDLVSASLCERVLDDFQECIDFARATHSAAKHPVPPLPAGLPRGGPGGPLPSSQTAPELNRSSASPQSPPPNGAPHRISSPPNSLSPTNSGTFSPPRFGSPVTSERDEILSGGMAPMRMQDGPVQMQMQMGAQRVPALHDAAGAPQRTSSQGQVEDAGPLPPIPGGPPMGPQPGQIFGPGQIMPGGGAFGGPPGPGQQFGPGMVMGRGPGGPPMGMQGRPGPGPGPRQISGGMGSPMDPRGPPPMGMNGPPPPPPHDGPPGMQRQGSIPQPRPMPPGAGPFGAGPLGTRSTPATPVNGGPFPAPPNPPFASVPHRPPSDPSFQGGLRKAASSHGLNAQYDAAPPVPGFLQRRSSQTSLAPSFSATLPSARLANSRSPSMRGNGGMFSDSPPASPEANAAELPPEKVTSSVSATMKCKVYLKQQHAQWKALGSAKLKLWKQEPGNVKQLVVEADDRQKSTLISTIVLTDGVERVGKTGVAVELSDRGARTGIVYMIQLRNEQSCVGLYESLLAGSDRAG